MRKITEGETGIFEQGNTKRLQQDKTGILKQGTGLIDTDINSCQCKLDDMCENC